MAKKLVKKQTKRKPSPDKIMERYRNLARRRKLLLENFKNLQRNHEEALNKLAMLESNVKILSVALQDYLPDDEPQEKYGDCCGADCGDCGDDEESSLAEGQCSECHGYNCSCFGEPPMRDYNKEASENHILPNLSLRQRFIAWLTTP